MPEISRFYGIVLQIYFGDHPPPHFHARYAGHAIKIDIETLSAIEGQLPARAMGLVIDVGAAPSTGIAGSICPGGES
jgi:Domain of unknown function (DUF4160)